MEFMTRLRSVFRNEKGLVDLGSVMVGSVIAAILAAGAGVAIIGVIRASENNTAKEKVNVAVLSEKSYFTQNDIYGAKQALVTSNLLNDDPNICVTTDATNTTYKIASRTNSGKIYYTTSDTKGVITTETGTNKHCFA